MRRYTFTPYAQHDIDEIANYLRSLPKAPALRIGKELQRTIEIIADRPNLAE